MTNHTFKVGDRGKTRGGDDYEVTAVGRDMMLVYIESRAIESRYDLNGLAKFGYRLAGLDDLLPPKRRIQGWFNWFSNNAGHLHIDGPYEDKEAANIEARRYKVICVGAQRIACIYIDTEEGEGL